MTIQNGYWNKTHKISVSRSWAVNCFLNEFRLCISSRHHRFDWLHSCIPHKIPLNQIIEFAELQIAVEFETASLRRLKMTWFRLGYDSKKKKLHRIQQQIKRRKNLRKHAKNVHTKKCIPFHAQHNFFLALLCIGFFAPSSHW